MAKTHAKMAEPKARPTSQCRCGAISMGRLDLVDATHRPRTWLANLRSNASHRIATADRDNPGDFPAALHRLPVERR